MMVECYGERWWLWEGPVPLLSVTVALMYENCVAQYGPGIHQSREPVCGVVWEGVVWCGQGVLGLGLGLEKLLQGSG